LARHTVDVEPTERLEGPAFDAALDELLHRLTALQGHFRVHGPNIWVREIDRDLELLRTDDAYAGSIWASSGATHVAKCGDIQG
jgi:hypothetical protein